MFKPKEKEEKIQRVGNGGFLLKQQLCEEDQIALYKRIVALARGSVEEKELRSIPYLKSAWPLAYWNHSFTKSHNCEKPCDILEWANKLFQKVVEYDHQHPSKTQNDPQFRIPKETNIDSFGAQMYPSGGALGAHVDRGLLWGISVSLGASCLFFYGAENVVLDSGDVFIGCFGKVVHRVQKTLPETIPKWWKDDKELGIDTYGKVRCNIQLRDRSVYTGEISTKAEFKMFLHELAKRIEADQTPFGDQEES